MQPTKLCGRGGRVRRFLLRNYVRGALDECLSSPESPKGRNGEHEAERDEAQSRRTGGRKVAHTFR